ncbi:MAG: hypothetical protein ACR2P1_28435 [Pseudomonadales bacterium]
MQSFLSPRKAQSLGLCKYYLHVKHCVTLAVLMCAVVPIHTAFALSCAREATLQKTYDSSKYIVIAKLAACTKTWGATSGSCQEWALEIDEVLKGESPPKKVRSGTGYSLPRTGDIRLLFSHDDAIFYAGDCGHGGLLDREGSERVREKADRLRNYRDGVAADLSEPWRFRNNDGHCRISHRFEGGNIHLGYSSSREQ